MEDRLYIVGVGASAGGLEALTDLFANLPSSLEPVTSFIVAQHLSPTHRSMLVQILAKEAVFPVYEAVDNQEIESGKIYITPPDSDIQVVEGRILLTKPKKTQGPKPSVDFFFSSLSLEMQESAIGIILSGTGSDGALGLQEIKNRGGTAIIQNPDSAKYDGMPLSALQTGVVDFSLPSDKIGLKLEELILHQGEGKVKIPESDIQEIFLLVNKKFGVNFENYKPSTIFRRIDKGMRTLKIPTIHDYLGYLRENPEEVGLCIKAF